MDAQTRIPSFACLTQHAPASPRSQNMLHAADEHADTLMEAIDSAQVHVAGALSDFATGAVPALKICSNEEFAALVRHRLIGADRKPDESRLAPLDAAIADKRARREPLDRLETAVTHFRLQQRALGLATRRVNDAHDDWIRQRADYDPANNGKYPYRDTRGNALRVVAIDPVDDTGTLSCATVKPFLSFDLGEAERAQLYSRLSCRRFEKSDIQSPQESALIGQRMVLANEDIPAGGCLGVYGGTLLRDEDVKYVRDSTYLFDAARPNCHRPIRVDGDNILSRINTCFDYDAEGRPIAQATKGYNLQGTGFRARLADDTVFKVTALFALQDLRAGEELRLNYLYDADYIAEKHGGGKPDSPGSISSASGQAD